MSGGFEGSYMGANDRISARAIMECKICWTPYDPTEGDDFRQIDPGTPFSALPEDWSCPTCSAPKEQFLVREDPGSRAAAEVATIGARTTKLVSDFTEVYHSKMRDVPLVNNKLQVQAVGFRMHGTRIVGVLISPWFMNLVLLPAEDENWDDLVPGAKEFIPFPSGDYEFLHNTRPEIGGYKACSLFSPMHDFQTQAQTVEVAEAVMVALYDEANKAETDRAQDIRAAREAELGIGDGAEAATDDVAGAEAGTEAGEAALAPDRRAVITGGLGKRG